MEFSDGGKVVEDKMLNAVLEQRGFLAVFTGKQTSSLGCYWMLGKCRRPAAVLSPRMP